MTTSLARIAVLSSALLLAAPVTAQDAAPDRAAMNVEQISTHMGEMSMAADAPVEIDDSLVFEPYHSIDDMFFRDDVVYLMRHGPTDWSKLDRKAVAPTDCADQRVMNPEGRANMRDLGALLAHNEVLPARIVVSQWCRNQQTVDELLAGVARIDPAEVDAIPVETDGDLNLLLSLQGASDTTGLRARIAAWDGDPGRDGPLLVVSHYTNIEELTQFRVFEGEILVLDPDCDNRVVGYLRLRSAAPDRGHFAEALASPLVSDDAALDMVARYYDALEAQDEAMLADVLSDRWVVHGVEEEAVEGGDAAFLDYMAGLREALDGARFTVADLYVTDGVVTVIGRIEGRHTGEFFGVAPTGRAVAFDGVAVHRIEDGAIAETWQMADRAALMAQITR